MRGFGILCIIIGVIALVFNIVIALLLLILGAICIGFGSRPAADPQQLWATREDHIIAARDRKPLKQVIEERLYGGARAPCPHCAEPILRAAAVCHFCKRDLPEDWASSKPTGRVAPAQHPYAGPTLPAAAPRMRRYLLGLAGVIVLAGGFALYMKNQETSPETAAAPPPPATPQPQPSLNALAAMIMRDTKPCRYAKSADDQRGSSWRVVCADGEIYRVDILDVPPTVVRCAGANCMSR